MGDQVSLPAWKKSKAVAGAMMLLKGYAEPVTICDHCGRALERASGLIDVEFSGQQARYPCPHCGGTSVRDLKAPGAARG